MKRSLAGVVIGVVLLACGGATSPSIGDAGGGGGDGGGGGADGGGVADAVGGGGGGSTCTLPKEVGPCEAAIERFWFNQATGNCEAFTYGGCEGNANNFEHAEFCVAACAPSTRNACDRTVCRAGYTCAFQRTPAQTGLIAVCAQPCDKPGSSCSGGPGTCECAPSCSNCADCVDVCFGR